MSCYKDIPKDILERHAIFFFGSKKKWVLPSSDAERKEQPSNYKRMASPLRDLIRRKHSQGHVHFLKKPSLDYRFYPGPPDPKAYSRASAWFEKLGYEKLTLDPKWWKTKSGLTQGAIFKIIRNFENGFHDYNEVRRRLL